MGLFNHKNNKNEDTDPDNEKTQEMPALSDEKSGNDDEAYFQDVPGYPVKSDESDDKSDTVKSVFDDDKAGSKSDEKTTESKKPVTDDKKDAPKEPKASNQVTTDNTKVSTKSDVNKAARMPSELNDWQQTASLLEQLDKQRKQLKEQLKMQLLNSRTIYKHEIRNKEITKGTATSDITYDKKSVDNINRSLRQWFGTDAISGEVYLDPQRNFFILQDKLSLTNNRKRNNLAALDYYLDNYGILPTLVTIDYDHALDSAWSNYVDDGIVNPDSSIVNVYKYFQNQGEKSSPIDIQAEINSGTRVETDQKLNIDHVYDGDKLIMDITKDDGNSVKNIYHYHDNKLLSLDYLDAEGRNSMTKIFDPNNSKKVVRENYYRQDNTLAVVHSYAAGEPRVQIYNKSNIMAQTFDTDQEFLTWWLLDRVVGVGSTVVVPLSSPVFKNMLHAKHPGIDILPYVDDLDKQGSAISDMLADSDLIPDGVLVRNQTSENRIDKLSGNLVNVTVVSPYDDSSK